MLCEERFGASISKRISVTSFISRVVDVDSEYISDGVGDQFRVTSPPMYPPPPPVTATKTQPQISDSVMSQGT